MSRIVLLASIVMGSLITMGRTRAEEQWIEKDPLWKSVQQALEEGRPQTALERLEPIAKRAKQSGDVAEQIRVVVFRIDLQSMTTDEPADAKLKKLRAAIDVAEAGKRPVMEAILATWMWDFFQQNRWQFAGRTAVAPAAAPSNAASEESAQASDSETSGVFGVEDDLLTWDLARILRAIDRQFQRSLETADSLKQMPIERFEKLVAKGTVPAGYRPTMYDLLVHHALEFFMAGEQAGSRSIHAFDLTVESPIFANQAEFLAWEPVSTDDRAPLLVAAKLFQDLLRFHQQDADPTARLDADLLRLEFGNNHAVGAEKSGRYRAALERFIAENRSHPISARAQANLATLLVEAEDFVAAHALAKSAIASFPDSIGAKRCQNLIQGIEAREVQTMTERVWNAPSPTIDVTYRNITKIYFRLVPFDFLDFAQSHRWQPEQLEDRQDQRLLAARPARAWSADLPATEDYKQKVQRLPIPDDLSLGSYFLISSAREDFSQQDNQLGIAEVWVSNLALVSRSMTGEGVIAGHVLDARTGTPISGVTVQAWQHDRSPKGRTILPPVTTDRDGEFQLSPGNRGSVLLLATHGSDRLSSASFLSSSIPRHETPTFQTTQFFTDRSIYRPGQTIRYKGICLRSNRDKDDYSVVAKQPLTVVLMDANGQEVERLEHRTNDYGSFSGSFTAPRGRLTGAMTIRVLNGPQGQTTVMVEEYKRPKFEVKLESPEEAAKLNSEVVVTGQAAAYTGANVSGANVQWRVVREVRFPPWWYWRMWWLPPMRNQSQEIARGSAVTDEDGKFQVQFAAKPDLSVAADSEPTFRFTVYADVTDGAGETRSSDVSVNVGYTALSASISADAWLTTEKNISLTISTTSLDGVGQSAEGVVKIYSLKQPDQVVRAPMSPQDYGPIVPLTSKAPPQDMSRPASWPLGAVVFEATFKTDAAGNHKLDMELPAGIYRAVLSTADRFGQKVAAELPMEVFDLKAPQWNVRLPNRVQFEKPSIEPGQTLRGLWASGYPEARALIEVEHRGKIIRRYWTEPGKTQNLIELPIVEEMRGGINIHTMMVHENRAYLESTRIDVPWRNKELDIRWERFVSKLGPSQKETWTAVIQGSDAQRAAAEMVATLYDASLDAFTSHQWISGFGVFRQEHSHLSRAFGNVPKPLQLFVNRWTQNYIAVDWRYPTLDFPRGYGHSGFGAGGMGGAALRRARGGAPGRMYADGAMMESAPMPMAMEAAADTSFGMAVGGEANMQKSSSDDMLSGAGAEGGNKSSNVSLEGIPVRKNLNETAFFFPHATAGEDGVVRLEFTMPEALTRWRFMGFAHDQKLRGGLFSDTAVTSKDIMIQPNAPRFLREGDIVEFTAKVTNLSPTLQSGQAGLGFSDPQSGQSRDAQVGNSAAQQSFSIPAGGSQTLSWRIQIPDDLTVLTYRVVATTGRLSDGEEGYLPILSRRILVTESLPLPIRGPQTKQFEFKRLLESGKSDSIRHQSLTVQMTSNPAWYAVLSLPYLMEYPHQCSEQIFNRLYANSLAQHVAGSDPKIQRVFEQWQGTDALDSPMEKNQELKAVLLEESPWVRQAQSESQSRRNVAVLFDQNRLRDELQRALEELGQRQLPDGRWSWFPDGPASDYITLYITTGFGRLQHLGVRVDPSMAIRSLQALDQWMSDNYNRVLEAASKASALATPESAMYLGHDLALYLYGRSFFIAEHPIAPEHAGALEFWLKTARLHWLKLDSLQSQAHLALALARFGDRATAGQIMVSLKERSVSNEEMGTYWKPSEQAYWWYHAPIETQAALIEAFDEVAKDAEMVESCKVWLIKQKQTQHWHSTKATADAVYALLGRGENLLASDRLVEIELAGQRIQPEKVEAGTGFFEQRRVGSEVTADLGSIRVVKQDQGVAWGSIHWQYFEDMDRITQYTGTPLTISKELYVKRNTDSGPQLQPVNQEVATDRLRVGDELVVRLVLKVDRDMEFVHLKDHRGSGTEPINVLSGYRYQDGLGYYESTRDTASHFFIDYLRKGTYVFEYSTRVQLRGSYQTGMANVQCMYAPEFGSHSQSIRLEVVE